MQHSLHQLRGSLARYSMYLFIVIYFSRGPGHIRAVTFSGRGEIPHRR
jgi:hypothetical protein